MLATLDPALLERIRFPLGAQSKAETRAQAAEAGLAAAGRRESQEACFLAGGDYRAFLERQGFARGGAAIVESGAGIGTHDGYWRFTPASGAASVSRAADRSTSSGRTGSRTGWWSARASRWQ